MDREISENSYNKRYKYIVHIQGDSVIKLLILRDGEK